MAVKLLWYLTSPDGPYPWLESGRWEALLHKPRAYKVYSVL